ncbi:response regulator [Aestuariibacter sp. AA17]|uniref:histidine kinase n=1 Tax=Fluctibacter corallii TaxID=2984329 RepID=A0ABT3A8L5_9ALTE|nr:response regulator [Aestuariibacter sp. AA17]MCV2885011.1 response regulator [Aestuariibacter sp. AA17]
MKLLHKLLFAFSSIVLTFVIVLLVIYSKTDTAKKMGDHLASEVMPLTKSLLVIESELQTSMASLRGYMLLGNEEKGRQDFLARRAKAWRIISRHMLTLQEYEQERQITLLVDEMSSQFQQFRQIQGEIEGYVGAASNIPARQTYENALMPNLKVVLSALTRLMTKSSSLNEVSVITALADIRYLTAGLSADIAAYLQNQSFELELDIKGKLALLEERLIQTDMPNDFSLQKDWDIVQLNMPNVAVASRKIIIQRSQPSWNNARYLLTSRALPLVKDIFDNIDKIQVIVSELEVRHIEEFSEAENAILAIIKYATLVMVLVSCAIAFMFSRYLSDYIVGIRKKADELALGYVSSTKLATSGRDELSQLSAAVNRVSENLDAVIKQAQAMSKGILDQPFSVISEQDQLGTAINSLQSSFMSIEEQAKQIAQHNYKLEIVPRSERDSLLFALRDMLVSLRQSEEENYHRDWLKNGINSLNKELRFTDSLQDLAINVLDVMMEHISASAGGFYLVEGESAKLIASRGYTRRKIETSTWQAGDGLIGQVMIEKSPIVFERISEDYLTISSGLGETSASSLAIIPYVYKGELKGIIELAFMQAVKEGVLEYANLTLEPISVSIDQLQARDKVNELLEKTKAQSVKLEEQTQALEISRADLEQQQLKLKRNNVELEEKTSELEQKNHTLSLLKEKLEEKALQMQQASRYKSEFLANMSHELRTPLNSLLLLSKELAANKHQHLNDDEVQSAEIIHQSGSELLTLINDILDLSKIEAGRMSLHITEVTKQDIENSLMAMFNHMAQAKGLSFEVQTERSPETFKTDKTRLMQILKNLVGNGIKFTESGYVRVRISPADEETCQNLKIDHAVVFEVQDSGIGIDESKLELIFDAFQQEDGSTSRKYGGTGLGLSICKQLANLLNGYIDVSSEVNKGSIFRFVMPVDFQDDGLDEVLNGDSAPTSPNLLTHDDAGLREDKKQPTSDDDTSRSLSTSDEASSPKGVVTQHGEESHYILIVEDDEGLAKSLAKMVEKFGFDAAIAGTAREGLQQAIALAPLGVMLDIGLPDVSGLELLKTMKQHPDLRDIPVHVVTGSEINVRDILEVGGLGVLTKPLDSDHIEHSVNLFSSQTQLSGNSIAIIAGKKESERLTKLLDEYAIQFSVFSSVKASNEVIENGLASVVICDCHVIPFEDVVQLLEHVSKQVNPPKVLLTRFNSQESEDELKDFEGHYIIADEFEEHALIQKATLFIRGLHFDPQTTSAIPFLPFQDAKCKVKNKRVLVVDDDMRNTFAVAKILKDEGIIVDIASNGQEAIKKLTNATCDLVLMDIMMPVMDGYECIKQIRQTDTLATIPIIAVTAKAMLGEREKCIELGANDFISKPIESNRLLAVVYAWLCMKV